MMWIEFHSSPHVKVEDSKKYRKRARKNKSRLFY